MQNGSQSEASDGGSDGDTKRRPRLRQRRRRASGWFDSHPRFLETSHTAINPGRLNMRYQALIADNADILAGARVLDIASHDGRWALAALEAGAAHVTSIEARPDLVDNAHETFAHYGADPSRYTMIAGDVFAVLKEQRFDVDVIQCFGFLYHTLRYPELFSALRKLEPRHLVVDTRVHRASASLIRVYVNETTVQSNAAFDDYTEGTKTLVGSPSPKALRRMLGVFGFTVEREYDWEAASRDAGAAVGTYERGERITWRCSWDVPRRSKQYTDHDPDGDADADADAEAEGD
ncbi:MAG: Methyltransferase type 11 [Nocardioidaceae bacterium]|nr:Methyltransferase type 11 [Nocardioidaceae bacterium]